MTNPYAPYPPPRKLERSRSDRVMGGVCGGLAAYANMDPTLVRVLTVVVSLFTGVPIILYLIALFIMPEESPGGGGPAGYPPVTGPQSSYGAYPPGTADGAYHPGMPPEQPSYAPGPHAGPTSGPGAGGPPREDPAVWGPQGAPWEPGGADPDRPFDPRDERR